MNTSRINTRCRNAFFYAIMLMMCAGYNLVQADDFPSREGHWPLNQHMVPGTAAKWSQIGGVTQPGVFQAVKFEVPVKGLVTVYSLASPQGVTVKIPGVVFLETGHLHRVRIHDLEGMPGVEIFPSIEVLDRVHPPQGKETDFAIPLEITARELNQVLQDRLLDKVIYVESPQTANLFKRENEKVYTEQFPPSRNLLKEADIRGRPVLMLKLGSRRITPKEHHLLMGTGGQFVIK